MAKRGGASGKSSGGGARANRKEVTTDYKEVTNDKIFDKAASDWRGEMTGDEHDIVVSYTDTFYSRVNYDLRWDNYEDFGEEISLLDSAISKFNLTNDIVVFRGVSKSAFGGSPPQVGSVISDKAFLSTTVSKTTAQSFGNGYVLKINVPKGKGKGAYVDSISYHKGEREFLMPRNTKLKITGTANGSKEGFGSDKTVVYAEYV